MERWLAGIRKKRAAGTWNAYRLGSAKHVVPHLGHVRLSALRKRDVSKWIEDMEEAGVPQGERTKAVNLLANARKPRFQAGNGPTIPTTVHRSEPDRPAPSPRRGARPYRPSSAPIADAGRFPAISPLDRRESRGLMSVDEKPLHASGGGGMTPKTGRLVVVGRRLIRAAEVAQVLCVSESMVYKLTKAGKLKAVLVGGSLRYWTDEVEDYIQANRTTPGRRKRIELAAVEAEEEAGGLAVA